VSADRQVATVTLDRPDRRNSQTPHTWISLVRCVNDLPGTVRVLVLRGEGPSFSSGLDRSVLTEAGSPEDGTPSLTELVRGSAAAADITLREFQEAFSLAARPGLVSIALVQGHAIGAGFQLALSCDIRIATEDALFAMAEVSFGLVPDLGGTKRLVELVGYSRAASICLTGRPVTAAEADRIGLVAAVVGADELDDAGNAYVQQILRLPRNAVIEIKALLLAAAQRSQSEQESAERAAQYRRLRDLAGLDE
jgi:enoyl-CoA hydratase/carnithine racemase